MPASLEFIQLLGRHLGLYEPPDVLYRVLSGPDGFGSVFGVSKNQ